MDTTRCLLDKRKNPNKNQVEALNTTVYLLNKMTAKTLHDMTPYEALCGNKPSIKYLKIFGCICYYQVFETKMNKVDNKAHKGKFMGYNSSKGYMIFYFKISPLIFSQEVKFYEAPSQEWKNQKTSYSGLSSKSNLNFKKMNQQMMSQ